MTNGHATPVVVSSVFADWAAPLLALIEGSRRAERQRALTVAATVWNAVVLDEAGVEPGALQELFDALARLPPEEGNPVLATVKVLVARKQGPFADARWAVSRCELRAGGRLFVEARALPSPPAG